MRLPARVLVPLMLLAVALMALLSRGGHLPASAQLPPESPTPIPTMPPEPFAPGGRAVPIPQPTAMPPIRPLPPVPPLGLVRLDRFTATVDIQDQTAFTAVDLDFRNNGDRQDEATLLFPIPPGVAVSDFTMTVNGETLEGELIGREEAARIYTSIVASRRDPALLEYAGQNLLRARVFPVPPRGESRLTIRFTQLLERENGAVRYRLPLTAGADVGPTLSKLALNVTVSGSQGVLSLPTPRQPRADVERTHTSRRRRRRIRATHRDSTRSPAQLPAVPHQPQPVTHSRPS